MIKYLEKLINDFNGLKNDQDRFKFILGYKNVFQLNLDNDMTYPSILDSIAGFLSEDQIDSLPEIDDFDSWLGWTDGVQDLLKTIGVKSEPV